MQYMSERKRREFIRFLEKLGPKGAKDLLSEAVGKAADELIQLHEEGIEPGERFMVETLGKELDKAIRGLTGAGTGKKAVNDPAVKLAQKLLRQKVSHACVADLTHLSLDEIKRIAADL
ncbi:MAG: hypothetical protein LBF58_11120 [Deltaproteobacteria bacterium]|jgi:uncharacterized protein YgbK (DUF1537 family)|nr:hypothetical protein [Deltaproteobacteria bacterium]